MSLLLMAFDIMIMEIVYFVEEKKLSKLTCLLKYKIIRLHRITRLFHLLALSFLLVCIRCSVWC